MIPELDPATGFLPRGRYPCIEEEIFNRFVRDPQFSDSKTRAEVWSHWQAARTFVLPRVPVYRAWLGGSFVTSKVDPDDLDVVWTWDADAVDQLSAAEQAVLAPFLNGREGLARWGLRIDSYVVLWRCYPTPGAAEIELDPYFRSRGYWDDFWMRARTGSKEETPKSEDAYPRRGYLEVTFREYS